MILMTNRPYETVAEAMSAAGSLEQRMQTVADALWEALSDKGVSWVGFYVDRPGVPDDRRLELGDEYIPCDPADRSEITVPLVDERGACWGVLDLDSRDVAAFDESDERGLCRVLRAAGLL
jgi:putative methionine-R-sulfoxide reductase with GAF domain